MPSTYAHYTFGRKVIDGLSKNNRENILKNIELFDIGVHGPDILFYYKPYKKNKINKKGSQMHKESGYTFFNSNKYLINKSKAHEAYLYGFLCHFALDQACHKYVGEVEQLGYEHTKIESEFEKYLMLNDGIIYPREKKLTNHIHPSKENSDIIKDFFSGLKEKDIENSLRGMIFFHEFLRSPGKVKRGFLNFIFTILRMRYFHGLLISKKDENEFKEFNEELFRRYNIGIENAIELIENFRPIKKKIDDFEQIYFYDFGSKWRGQ